MSAQNDERPPLASFLAHFRLDSPAPVKQWHQHFAFFLVLFLIQTGPSAQSWVFIGRWKAAANLAIWGASALQPLFERMWNNASQP